MFRGILISLACFFLVCSCEKNINGGRTDISFSEDTISFDTVFTTIGTTTRELRVYNKSGSALVIDEIALEGSASSKFRINIDGESLFAKQNVEIPARDSIFIFIDALIDPTNQSYPVSIKDAIAFRRGSNLERVILQAWGQDIILLKDKVIQDETWTGNKPYVIYGNLLIDTLATLTIEGGVRVLFHRESSMTVAGKLNVNGSKDSRVLFASDRTEGVYNDVPGQWKGIHLLNTSQGNTLYFATIRGANTGLTVGEEDGKSGTADINLNSTDISHNSVSCLSAFRSRVSAINSVFSHSGKYCILLSGGGNYEFTHCTLYNIWDYGFRSTPLLYMSELPLQAGSNTLLNARFSNSIIHGDVLSEINTVPSGLSYSGIYVFDNDLIRIDTSSNPFWSKQRFRKVIVNKSPVLIDVVNYDYRPDTLSPVINAGSPDYTGVVPFDFRGVSRILDAAPDIGAFERLPGEKKKKN
ncbi:MAG: choice-of-anchor Q domain-containing protein [Bacteroidales bacterium]